MAKKHRPRKRAEPTRLQAYRPFLEKLLFGLALLGVLTTVHLWIQESRGFDQGCWGFNPPAAAAAATFNCEAVVQSEAGTLFGIPNVVLGLLFYVAVAALTAAAAFASATAVRTLKRLRAGLITLGFLYSVFLVFYQYVELKEYCALCLTSAAIVSVLFVLQAVDFFKPPKDRVRWTMQSPKVMREAGVFAALALLALLLVGADLLYFNSLEAPAAPPQPLAQTQAEDQAEGGTRPVNATEECFFDPEKRPVPNYHELIDFTVPMKGNARAPVTVIEYFDPNCPHCKSLHEVMNEVIEEHGDQAAFYYKPFVLRPNHPRWLNQVEALYAAAQEGKFFEMMEQQFAVQHLHGGEGLSSAVLRQIASDIGMNPDAMMNRIQGGLYRNAVLKDRQQAIDIGLTGVPMVIVNGQVVGNRTEECLAHHITQAAQQQ